MNQFASDQFRKIALNLEYFRRGLRIDQREFAKRCNISRYQYLRAEDGRGPLTLETLFKICETFEIEIIELFKNPTNRTIIAEKREKIRIQGNESKIVEEKYLSQVNKKTVVKKLIFREQQKRTIRFQERMKFEIFILKGETIIEFNSDSVSLKEGQHLALDFNPQLSFEKNPYEHFKICSVKGAEVLLIQTVVH